MPAYEKMTFKCNDCGTVFDKKIKNPNYKFPSPTCPKCGSTHTDHAPARARARGKYKLEHANEQLRAAVQALAEGRGFRGTIRGGVPIGEYQFKITPDNPKEIQFIVGSVEAREGKLKVAKKTDKYVIVSGDAFTLTSMIRSIQRASFDGKFEQL